MKKVCELPVSGLCFREIPDLISTGAELQEWLSNQGVQADAVLVDGHWVFLSSGSLPQQDFLYVRPTGVIDLAAETRRLEALVKTLEARCELLESTERTYTDMGKELIGKMEVVSDPCDWIAGSKDYCEARIVARLKGMTQVTTASASEGEASQAEANDVEEASFFDLLDPRWKKVYENEEKEVELDMQKKMQEAVHKKKPFVSPPEKHISEDVVFAGWIRLCDALMGEAGRLHDCSLRPLRLSSAKPDMVVSKLATAWENWKFVSPSFSEVQVIAEAKRDSSQTSTYGALGELRDRKRMVFDAQPGRKVFTCALMLGTSFQLVRFHRDSKDIACSQTFNLGTLSFEDARVLTALKVLWSFLNETEE